MLEEVDNTIKLQQELRRKVKSEKKSVNKKRASELEEGEISDVFSSPKKNVIVQNKRKLPSLLREDSIVEVVAPNVNFAESLI